MVEQAQLYQEAFKSVFKMVKATFPFSSEKKFLNFKKIYDGYYGGLLQVENDCDFFIHLYHHTCYRERMFLNQLYQFKSIVTFEQYSKIKIGK